MTYFQNQTQDKHEYFVNPYNKSNGCGKSYFEKGNENEKLDDNDNAHLLAGFRARLRSG